MIRPTTVLILTLLPLPACKHSTGSSQVEEAAMAGGSHETSMPSYHELAEGERIYVFGSDESLATFQATGHMPYTKTLIGEGPAGETVVFEAEAKGRDLQERLMAEWDQRHYYVEIEKGGRLYVLGTKACETSLREHGHVPYTRTRIGDGPGGMTLVFESESKGHDLADRLEADYWSRHADERR